MNDTPLFSRPADPDRQFVELRTLVPIEVIAYIDAAASLANKRHRGEMIVDILTEWARRREHAVNVYQRTTRGNPPLPDCDVVA